MSKLVPSDDPYRSINEWRSAQQNLINHLKVGDELVYIRLFHVYNAGAVTSVDTEKQIVHTDKGYEFIYNLNSNRYVLRGDPHAFMARYFSEGAKGYRRFTPRTRVPVTNRSRELD